MKRRQSDNSLDDETELAGLADGSLPEERRSRLEARLEESEELSQRLAEQERALALTQSAVAGVSAPAGLRRRIESERTRRSRTPRRLAIAGSVGVLAAAAAIGVIAVSHADSPGFHAALASTSLAPGAHGEATLTRHPSGWRVELDATGLPRLSDGAFYEAWLRNDAGVLVPIGTFNDGRDVTLWAGVAPNSFKTLTVTRERADGDQSSSGVKVLVGTVTEGG